MPWFPDHFSAQFLTSIDHEGKDQPIDFFDGLMSGEVDALASTFAGVPELHHPVHGRVKGAAAFSRFVEAQRASLVAGHATVTPVDLIVTASRVIEEVTLELDGEQGRTETPVAIVADRNNVGQILEVRVYFSTWPATGSHANRPPVLQVEPGLHPADVVGEYQRALAAGDVEGILACFEASATVREPAGNAYLHRGTGELRELYSAFFSNEGGIPLEHCSTTDDGRACAVEYNVVRWGKTALAPEAGIAVYVRGTSGRLAYARIYDDTNPPI